METLRIRMLHLLFFSELHAVRLLLAVSEIVWGVSLLISSDIMSRPPYVIMSSVASGLTWGVIFTVAGLTQLIILVMQNYHSKLSILFACVNSMLWWYYVISMYLSLAMVTAAITGNAALALGASWVFIRSGLPQIDRRKYDRRRKTYDT